MTVSTEKMENPLIKEEEKSGEQVRLPGPRIFQTVNFSITVIISVYYEEKG